MASAKFKTGTVVKKTGKFLRSIGSVTAPRDGLVLGSSSTRLLVAWSDGLTYQIQAANVQRAKKQMEPASAKATVTAERNRARQTMDTEMWSPQEIDEIVASYVRDDGDPNPLLRTRATAETSVRTIVSAGNIKPARKKATKKKGRASGFSAAVGAALDRGSRDWYEYGWESRDMSPTGARWTKGSEKIEIFPNSVYTQFGPIEVRVDGFAWKKRFYATPAAALASVKDVVKGTDTSRKESKKRLEAQSREYDAETRKAVAAVERRLPATEGQITFALHKQHSAETAIRALGILQKAGKIEVKKYSAGGGEIYSLKRKAAKKATKKPAKKVGRYAVWGEGAASGLDMEKRVADKSVAVALAKKYMAANPPRPVGRAIVSVVDSDKYTVGHWVGSGGEWLDPLTGEKPVPKKAPKLRKLTKAEERFLVIRRRAITSGKHGDSWDFSGNQAMQRRLRDDGFLTEFGELTYLADLRAMKIVEESRKPAAKAKAKATKTMEQVRAALLRFLEGGASGARHRLTDLAALPVFRGVHFSRLEKAAEQLAEAGKITFNGVSAAKKKATTAKRKVPIKKKPAKRTRSRAEEARAKRLAKKNAAARRKKAAKKKAPRVQRSPAEERRILNAWKRGAGAV